MDHPFWEQPLRTSWQDWDSWKDYDTITTKEALYPGMEAMDSRMTIV